MTWKEKAQKRVGETPELKAHEYMLLEYDWPNDTEHWWWVATRPIAEIIDWAETVEPIAKRVLRLAGTGEEKR